ncbi:MAG: flagellar biosynthetic protein FliO [Thermoleophilaceae bacterium]
MKSLPRIAFTAAFLFSYALPARALAAVQGPNENKPVNLGSDTSSSHAASAGSSGGGFFRMLFGLLIVVGVIYGVYWLLKKVKASKEEQASGRGLSTIATLPLGPNRSLHMVRAGGEVVILGVGESGVTPIRTYTEEEALELGLIGEDVDDFEDPDDRSPFTGQRSSVNASSPFRRALDQLRQATVRS